jgi:hypothetical protein
LKYWGEYKSLDSYLADFYALKREQDEALPVFNRRFYSIYHDMPLEIRPTETAAMIYYVMGLHSELVLLLLERKSSSLRSCLKMLKRWRRTFMLPGGSESRISLKICMHMSKQNVSILSDFEQEGNEYEADLEQQQACEFISDSVNQILQYLQSIPETGMM